MRFSIMIRKFQDRKIAQTVTVYLGSAWVIFEAFGFFEQHYQWNPHSLDVMLMLLLFGLPAVVLMRWFQGEEVRQNLKKIILLHILNFLAAFFVIHYTWNTSLPTARHDKNIPERSIAVLPFANLSHDPEEEYFSDGITEDIISKLYKIGNLQVTSRTSVLMFKNTTKPVQQIADELGVAFLLEGSVQRSQDKVRITARLIKADEDRNLWTDTFDEELRDVFIIQSKVAQKIAQELNIKLTMEEQEHINQIPTRDTAAYLYYQRGKFYLNLSGLENIKLSKEFFNKAIQVDPNFSAAYTGLAESCISDIIWGYITPAEIMPVAAGYVNKALELDPQSGEAYVSLASNYIYYTHEFDKAEEALREAIQLNPGYDVTYYHYAHLAFLKNQIERANEYMDKAIRLNPLAMKYRGFRIMFYCFLHEYEEALHQLKKDLELFPEDDFLLWNQGFVYIGLNQYSKAIESFLKRSVANSEYNWALGYTYAKAGEPNKAHEIIEFLVKKSDASYVPPTFIAIIYLGLSEKTMAFNYLNKAAELGDFELMYFEKFFFFDDLRKDPDYMLLRKRIFAEKNNIPL